MITYAERPWIKQYDPGIPASLTPYPAKTLHSFLTDSARRAPDSAALITTAKLPLMGRQQTVVTYGELDRQSDALAVALIELGLKPGQRVALVLPNVVAFPIAFYAVLKAGGIVAGTNPTYPAPRMAYQINDCDAEIVITLSMFYRMIKEIQPQTKARHVIVTNVKEYLPPLAKFLFTLAKERKDGHRVEQLPAGDFFLQDLLARYAGQKREVAVDPASVALFQYTGGTTGVSKGAMLTHQTLTTNTIQMQCGWARIDDPTFKHLQPEKLLFLGALPLFHAAGLIAVMGQAVAVGAPIVLVPNPRDIGELVDVIGHYQPTAFVGVPALYNAINNHPRVKSGEVSLKSIRLCTSGTAPLSPATAREYQQHSGHTIIEGYGMSECVVTHANPILSRQRIGSVGLPYPDNDVRIVSLEDGETDVPVGEVGEIVISGPTVMQGYHNMPVETASTLRDCDGKTWLYTGDIGRMDADGYFYIVDRKKDMAIIGGYNVYPTAVENVLREHPAVLDVGVAGIPHPKKVGQEALKAWIVVKPEMVVTEQALIDHCGQHLLAYEVPRRYAFVTEIPKTAVGKTLRRELVEREKAQ